MISLRAQNPQISGAVRVYKKLVVHDAVAQRRRDQSVSRSCHPHTDTCLRGLVDAASQPRAFLIEGVRRPPLLYPQVRKSTTGVRLRSEGELFFPYRFDRKYVGIWWPLGAREDVDGVTLTDDQFIATFGRKRLETPIANITGAHVTLDYAWWKAVGMRLSFVDDGLTFGTATHGGVCVHFDERVRRVIGRKDHSAVTVTVDDVDGLVEAVTARLDS